MQSYIKSHGKAIVGPLVNHSYSVVDNDGNMRINIRLIMQLDSPLHILDEVYKFKKQLKIDNCLFARFMKKKRI